MPRRPRIELSGGVHHVTAKATARRVLFVDERDRRRYLELLAREINERKWSLLTYCQMTNHLHALVRTPRPDLGLGFKRIHEEFAQHLNRRHALDGHAFGARFYSQLVRSDRHLLGCLRYIARNPVEAGMCRQPRDWAWSGHRALAGLADAPEFLDVGAAYDYVSDNPTQARLTYLSLVARSNETLVGDLAQPASDAWLLAAVDDFSISVPEIARFLGAGVSTTYRRLATARETQGTDP